MLILLQQTLPSNNLVSTTHQLVDYDNNSEVEVYEEEIEFVNNFFLLNSKQRSFVVFRMMKVIHNWLYSKKH